MQFPFRFSAIPRIIVVGDQPDLPVVAAAAAEVIRIEVGEARMGVDLDDRTIPQEGVDILPPSISARVAISVRNSSLVSIRAAMSIGGFVACWCRGSRS